ncbi:RING finger protein 10 [Macrosteles quadrilineatus]|uniref:RING finger protein 10 n=1 Tax=Macrosteles quadrilineatus TaxID=74068 RepID=UPI0023E30EE8|nr:RING finger protein 10 [Macrosteles quadrilineatus]
MLEDSNMEKKPANRVTQNPSKGSGTDSRKTQDANKQQFPKSSRRREPSNSNGSRSEQGRKPAPQKSKTLDKRPRPRGQYYGGGKEGTQVEEYETELGSLYSAGSKKQNLNHLLNFHYAPRGESARPVQRPSYQYGVKWLMSTQKHKYNKEHFLQANCQFVVRADTDYSPYLADPDLLVNWEFIEQIRVASLEPVSCPICLSSLVAGKMTRCGHMYCYPCILHYLALSDKSWRKCPICYESIHKNDLKSVKVESKVGHSVGKQITFQLMTRERGSLLACPVSQYEVRSKHKPVLNVSENQLDTAFAKLLTANEAEVLQIIDQEMMELDKEREENQGCPELCFIEQALELCAQRKQNIVSQVNNNKTGDIPFEEDSAGKTLSQSPTLPVKSANIEPPEDKEMSSSVENNVEYESAFDNTLMDINRNTAEGKGNVLQEENSTRQRYESLSSEGEDMSPSFITAEDLEATPHPTATPIKQFYFYQACDGQHIYLHAVNVQMLEMTYGTLRECPTTLTGVIVEKEAGSMTTELRRRLRYLQHLPVTAQFEVAEIQLLPPVVTQDTFLAFKDQLEQRRRRRQKRDREERKREKKIAEEELRQMGRHATPRLRLDSFHHFPQCGIPEDEIPSPPPRVTSADSSRTSSPLSRRSVSPTPALAALTLDSYDSGPSFAQMLRNSSGSSGPRGWGMAAAASKPRVPPSPSPPRHTIDSDGESAPAPGYHQSFSDAIAIALQHASEQKDETNKQEGKKKRKKQKVLFATGMACTSK